MCIRDRLDAGDPGCTFNQRHWDELVASGVIADDESTEPGEMKLSATRHGLA